MAYLDEQGTDNVACTKAMPCATAAGVLATKRPFVKVHGRVDVSATLTSGAITFLGDPGAALVHPAGDASILSIRGSAQVALHDLELSGPAGPFTAVDMPDGTPSLSLLHVRVEGFANTGIQVSAGTLDLRSSLVGSNTSGGGIGVASPAVATIDDTIFSATSGAPAISVIGTVSVTRCTFRNNSAGGLDIRSTHPFVVVGNAFVDNGSSSSLAGGVQLSFQPPAGSQLQFNSFANNQSPSGMGAGIHCNFSGSFNAMNNVLSGNVEVGSTNQTEGSGCSHLYTLRHPGPLDGSGDLNGDPLFVDPASGDLHLQAGSPARRAADPGADLTGAAATDIDGTARTAPADMGAFELHP